MNVFLFLNGYTKRYIDIPIYRRLYRSRLSTVNMIQSSGIACRQIERARTLVHILHHVSATALEMSGSFQLFTIFIVIEPSFRENLFQILVTVLYFLIILLIFHREGGSYTIDQHALEVLIYARYLRFLPVTWQRSICRRVEVYGTTSKFASIEFGM